MNQGQKQLRCKPRGKPWPPGVSGNPAGRPRGAVNKLSLAVKGGSFAVNGEMDSEQVTPPEPVKYDPRRPHTHTLTKIGGCWRNTISQDGQLFDRDTGLWIRDL